MAGTTADPRNIITQEAFSVAPHLLGLPLARPSRRLVAILLDLIFVAILVNLAGGALLGLAAAYAFFRFASRALGSRGNLGPKARLAFRVVGSIILFFVALNAWGAVREGRIPFLPKVTVNAADSVRVAKAEALGADEEEAAPRDTARGAEGREAAAGSALAPDSLLHLYAAALAASDTAAVDSLRPRVTSLVAADTVAELRERVAALQVVRDNLDEQLEAEKKRGLLSSILRLLDDLGIGFGWTGLYFTAFTALWKGQTPGKRLLGIRVVRLNGLPMTLWGAFERFGGYAAGLFTGLMGYAQVYWDRNRQGIHDKITETVVIRERTGQPLPSAPARTASATTLPPVTRV